MRLSHLLCAALGAAAVYIVLTREQRERGHGGRAANDGAPQAYDPATAAEALERRRVRAGPPVVQEGDERAAV